MSSTTVISAEMASGAPQITPWLIGVVVSLATFMEVLDTSIANVALPHIADSMGASNDESTWVLTSYLVSVLMFFLCFLPAKNEPGGSGNIQMH